MCGSKSYLSLILPYGISITDAGCFNTDSQKQENFPLMCDSHFQVDTHAPFQTIADAHIMAPLLTKQASMWSQNAHHSFNLHGFSYLWNKNQI